MYCNVLVKQGFQDPMTIKYVYKFKCISFNKLYMTKMIV